eukprot:2148430-Prymnesium_polylepis.1
MASLSATAEGGRRVCVCMRACAFAGRGHHPDDRLRAACARTPHGTGTAKDRHTSPFLIIIMLKLSQSQRRV